MLAAMLFAQPSPDRSSRRARALRGVLCGMVCATLALPPAFAADGDKPLSLADVVQRVIAAQPDLRAGAADIALREADEDAAQAMLDPAWNLALGVSDEKTPVSSAFQPTRTQAGFLRGGIAKPLAGGGSLALNMNYTRVHQTYASAFASQLAQFNPAWRNEIDLVYRHPLLKGRGNPAYSANLAASRAEAEAARLQRRATARQLALQAITAFYRLAADDLQARLARESVARAKRVLAWQKRRERFGLSDAADRLQAAALLAARRADLKRAQAAQRNDRAALNRLMLRDADAPVRIDPSRDPLPEAAPRSGRALIARASRKRPEILAIAASLEAARERVRIARDEGEMQLDLVLQAGTRSLDTRAAPAFTRGFSPKDRFLGLSVEMSDDFGGRRARAALKKALAAEAKLQALRDKALAQLRTDLANADAAIAGGLPLLRAARARVAAERAKFEAEMARYRDGRSNIATLTQFEESLHQARIQAEMQALSLKLAARQRQWALGELLDALGARLPETGGEEAAR